jgi:hypothetical protein
VTVDMLPGETVKVGSTITVRVTSSVPGSLLVYNQDHTGKSFQIFPNKHLAKESLPGQAKANIAAGQTVTVPGALDRFVFRITPPAGRNRIIAVVVPPEVKVDDIAEKNENFESFVDLDALLSELADREASNRGVSVEAAEPKKRAVGIRDYQIVQ